MLHALIRHRHDPNGLLFPHLAATARCLRELFPCVETQKRWNYVLPMLQAIRQFYVTK